MGGLAAAPTGWWPDERDGGSCAERQSMASHYGSLLPTDTVLRKWATRGTGAIRVLTMARIVVSVETGLNPALRAVSDAVLAIGSQQSTAEVLQRLVESARTLVPARYAALGVPDGEGGFSAFLTSGMSDKLIATLGPLPRTHGMLGAILEAPTAFRTADIHQDPRFGGWWPKGHPDMHSFLGVPIVSPEGVIGAFYLTEREGAVDFTAEDEELIELLAAHAAIAITNARLHERSRELSILSERNRLALELHDAVSQKLFGLVLNAEAAATLLDRDPEQARAQVAKLQELAAQALEELRSLIFELRPPDLEHDGLCGALRKHVDVLRRLQPTEIELEGDLELERDPKRDREVFRIAQEALQNALRHAQASRIVVRLRGDDGRLLLEIEDDGVGFDPDAPDLRSRRLGLTSMEERAQRLGARLEIDSAEGKGTKVHLETAHG
jgi:signal transduction histidine kinase